jgi:phosphoglycolate phosphatase
MLFMEKLITLPDPDARAVIHDFDGVVVNSLEFNKTFLPILFKELGLDIPSDAEISMCFHMSIRETIETLSGERRSIEIDQMVELAHTLDRPIEKLKFPVNQERTLEELSKEGLRLVIATSAEKINVEDAYKRKPYLREYFQGFVSIEDVTDSDGAVKAKPHPDALYKAAGLANVMPKNSVMIGDSDTDMVAAHNAGMPGIHLLFLPHIMEHRYAAASIKNYEEAPAAIQGIIKARNRIS